MQAKMDVIRGAKTKEIRLRLPTVIGRGGDSKLKLPASTVSRHHCEVYEFEGQIAIRDLGSSNGTMVNGHRIQGPTFITPEDEVGIGPIVARISAWESAEDSDVAPYPVAPAEEAAPTFEEVPAETAKPSVATMIDGVKVYEAELVEPKDDDSILQYAEPKSEGRSFVGIAPAEETVEPVRDAPAFENEDVDKPSVNPDDSALNDFFKNLDE